MTTTMAAPAERNLRVNSQAPHGWTIGDATLLGPHSRTRTARDFGSRVAVHLQGGIRLGAVDKADWPSANRMDYLQNAIPFRRSAKGSSRLKIPPRRN